MGLAATAGGPAKDGLAGEPSSRLKSVGVAGYFRLFFSRIHKAFVMFHVEQFAATRGSRPPVQKACHNTHIVVATLPNPAQPSQASEDDRM